jgi:hypothetical protein
MLAHTSGVPKVEPIGAEFFRIQIEGQGGAQHNPTLFVGADGSLNAIVRILRGMKTTNCVGRVTQSWSLAEGRQMVSPTAMGPRQLEDLRAFWWEGRLWAVAAIHDGGNPPPEIRQALLELSSDGSQILKVHTLLSTRDEKNWMPCVSKDDDLRVVYSIDPLVILRIQNVTHGLHIAPSAAAIPQTTGSIRGGSQLISWGGGWLAVVHQVYRRNPVPPGHNPLLSDFWPAPVVDPIAGNAKVVYLHHFARFNRELTTVAVSRPFYFRRIGIEFCAGLIRSGPKIVAAFGVADVEAWLAVLDDETIASMFIEQLETEV